MQANPVQSVYQTYKKHHKTMIRDTSCIEKCHNYSAGIPKKRKPRGIGHRLNRDAHR